MLLLFTLLYFITPQPKVGLHLLLRQLSSILPYLTYSLFPPPNPGAIRSSSRSWVYHMYSQLTFLLLITIPCGNLFGVLPSGFHYMFHDLSVWGDLISCIQFVFWNCYMQDTKKALLAILATIGNRPKMMP